jgi:hypothetical protein
MSVKREQLVKQTQSVQRALSVLCFIVGTLSILLGLSDLLMPGILDIRSRVVSILVTGVVVMFLGFIMRKSSRQVVTKHERK